MARQTNQMDELLSLLSKHPKSTIDIVLAVGNQLLSEFPTLRVNWKWNAPNFYTGHGDRITFNLSKKKCIRILFHLGSSRQDLNLQTTISVVPEKLKWLGENRAIIEFSKMEEFDLNDPDTRSFVEFWIASTTN